MADPRFSEDSPEIWFDYLSPWELTDDDLLFLPTAAKFNVTPTPQNDVLCFNLTFFNYFIRPMRILTIVANILVVYVWNAETKHHTTTYVFKMLAVTDILLNVASLIHGPIFFYILTHPSAMNYIIFVRASNSGMNKANVYVSLLLALVRLVKVWPGLSTERIFSRAKLRLYICFVCTWAFFLDTFSTLTGVGGYTCQTALRLRGETEIANRLRMAETVMNDHVGFSIPAFLQMVAMFVVVGKVRKHLSERAAGMTTEVSKAMRRLDYTVFCICCFTFVIHCVLRVVATIFKMNATDWNTNLKNLFRVINIGMITNGLINAFFYAIFVPRFRQLVMKRVKNFVEAFIFFTLDSQSIFSGQSTATRTDPYDMTTTTRQGDYTTSKKTATGGTFKTDTSGYDVETTDDVETTA